MEDTEERPVGKSLGCECWQGSGDLRGSEREELKRPKGASLPPPKTSFVYIQGFADKTPNFIIPARR